MAKDINCIFCKIVHAELPAYKIWENETFVAILDLYPNTRGQTLVLSKKHLTSYPFDLSEDDYSRSLQAARIVGKLLEQRLDVKRVAIIIEGMGIDHFHIKLYPLHGLSEKFQETWADKKVFYEKYEGHISTLMGPKAAVNDLEAIQKLIVK